MKTTSSQSAAHSGSGPAAGGARQLGRVHSTTAPPARSNGSSTKKSTSPTPPAPKSVKPNATYRQYVAWYGPLTLPGGTWYEAWANCPSGMVATGGGESNTSAAGVTLHDTYALSNGTGWKVRVTNDSTATATFTVYAVCMSGLGAYNQSMVSTDDGGDATATCPTGMQLLGGGGWSSNPNAVLTMQIGNDWWGATDYSFHLGTVTGQAICAEGVGNYSQQRANVTIAPGEYKSAVATCPAGTFVLGGGAHEYEMRPTDSYPPYPAQAWRIWAKNDWDNGWIVPAVAICGT